ncbi:hypothetical protein DFP72DRAFT_855523 [Ephemerocybe angulata]|uniref:Uncharacterized protein n=1 Tax=Ephemerocybe angulata TaxID=980116 RepID=A0A8H6HFX8_9AGAR|nr:hypothetical protein DFP72DRAFT_855523 [Tulosesus angulatus]
MSIFAMNTEAEMRRASHPSPGVIAEAQRCAWKDLEPNGRRPETNAQHNYESTNDARTGRHYSQGVLQTNRGTRNPKRRAHSESVGRSNESKGRARAPREHNLSEHRKVQISQAQHCGGAVWLPGASEKRSKVGRALRAQIGSRNGREENERWKRTSRRIERSWSKRIEGEKQNSPMLLDSYSRTRQVRPSTNQAPCAMSKFGDTSTGGEQRNVDAHASATHGYRITQTVRMDEVQLRASGISDREIGRKIGTIEEKVVASQSKPRSISSHSPSSSFTSTSSSIESELDFWSTKVNPPLEPTQASFQTHGASSNKLDVPAQAPCFVRTRGDDERRSEPDEKRRERSLRAAQMERQDRWVKGDSNRSDCVKWEEYGARTYTKDSRRILGPTSSGLVL